MNALRSLLAVLALLVATLTGATPALASTPYDNLFGISDDLVLRHYPSDSRVSHSTDWYNAALGAMNVQCDWSGGMSSTCSSATSLDSLLDGYWLVYEYQYDDMSQYNTYGIIWTTSKGGQSCQFVDGEPEVNQPALRCSGGGFYRAEFNYNNGMVDYDYPLVGMDEPSPQSDVYLYGATTPTGHQNVFLNTFPMTYPIGYDGKVFPEAWSPPIPRYVAMGDSFSSGEGVPEFEGGTDQDGMNECHRSPKAYPRLLQNDITLNLGAMRFVACSGATTNSVLYGHSGAGNWSEGPQVNALSPDTEIVTITIGGNDIGFKEFAEACLHPLGDLVLNSVCDEFTPVYSSTMTAITTVLPSKLESVFTTVMAKAPNAQVYIGGYPLISPYKYIDDPFDNECGGLYDEFPNTWGDARAAYHVVKALNDAIEDAVSNVNSQHSSSRLQYVSVESGSFSGHDICSGDRYFNGIDIFHQEYTAHPNIAGHQAYYDDFKEYMN